MRYVQLPNDQRWLKIEETLIKLKKKCEFYNLNPHDTKTILEKYGDPRGWLGDTVFAYTDNARVQKHCNFNVLVQCDQSLIDQLMTLLPGIIDCALSLPKWIAGNGTKTLKIPTLRSGQDQLICMDRNFICCLLANGFLSTFPKEHDGRKIMPCFNFWRLFDETNPDVVRNTNTDLKIEKIKCILEYFRRMGDGTKLPNSRISFERKTNTNPITCSHKKLDNIRITCSDKIEDATGMLQVDFANKFIGGGVITDGAFQEEIRFCISPELIVARLITPTLGDSDVIHITGTRQFSSYSGYAQSFEFRRLDDSKMGPVPQDLEGRELPQVVAMDALCFHPSEVHTQYFKQQLDREINKSYTAFSCGDKTACIATGNWGCGAFNGDPQLKFLLQWIAATENNRPVLYHARDTSQKEEFEEIVNLIIPKGCTSGQLYLILVQFGGDCLQYVADTNEWTKKATIFEYLKNSLKS